MDSFVENAHVQILRESDSYLHSANTIRKNMKPTIHPPAMGKIVGLTGLIYFGISTGLAKGSSEIKPVKLHFKNWILVAPCSGEEQDIYIYTSLSLSFSFYIYIYIYIFEDCTVKNFNIALGVIKRKHEMAHQKRWV